MFVAEKNSGRKRNKGRRKKDRLLGHKLNITDGFN
jgi:hypothetical protein